MEYMAPPEAIGLPSRYTSWRQNQADAILKAVGNDRRVTISICPTGFGKSLMYVAAGNILGGKTIILTSTKGLQTQLMNDFAEIGMVDVRGKNAYLCRESHDRLTCDQGMCNFGMFCPLRKGGCTYYDAIKTAQRASLVVTNYAFWLYSNEFGEGIGMPKLLVCDEGHDAPDEVTAFKEVKLDRSDSTLSKILPFSPENTRLKDWKQWANLYAENLRGDAEALQQDIQEHGPDEQSVRRLVKLRKMTRQLDSLSEMDLSNWVVNITPFEIQFAPIWVRDDCSKILFKQASRVILTSASVNYKTADMLGLEEDDCRVYEYPHTFPVDSRLVYCVQGARMNAKAPVEAYREWLDVADAIIEARLDRKGIFHTTAYHRRDFVMAHSRYARYMLSHHKRDLPDMIKEFKSAPPPKIFVSPSVTTGFDFPYDECEYQILGKIPFPDTRNIITNARCESDEEYGPYVAMQQLVQSCGRGSRAEDDQCENFVIDNNVGWFLKKNRKFAPRWFLDSVTVRIFPPQPPRRLKRRNHG